MQLNSQQRGGRGEHSAEGEVRVWCCHGAGKSARRFFMSADGSWFASDGKIVGWLPPEGEDEVRSSCVH